MDALFGRRPDRNGLFELYLGAHGASTAGRDGPRAAKRPRGTLVKRPLSLVRRPLHSLVCGQNVVARGGSGCYSPKARVPSRTEGRAVSYTHLRAHETRHDLVCRLLLEKKKEQRIKDSDM